MAQGPKQYTEKPYKVLAEPYDAAADPLQPGVCTCDANPTWTSGPHVHTPTGMVALGPTDWIVQDLWNNRWDVMPDEEFSARFGGGNIADVTPAEE